MLVFPVLLLFAATGGVTARIPLKARETVGTVPITIRPNLARMADVVEADKRRAASLISQRRGDASISVINEQVSFSTSFTGSSVRVELALQTYT